MGPAAARLAELEVALGAVAGAFAGRRVALRPAEQAGGALEGILLLPTVIELSPDPGANRDAFFVRAALSGARLTVAGGQRECQAGGSRPGMPARTDADEATLLSEAVRVAGELASKHPSFRARLARAAALELAGRPEPQSLPPHEAHLEALRHAALIAVQKPGPWTAFQSALEARDAEAPTAPERSFWHRLMFSRPPAAVGPGPTLLFGGPLTPSEREAALLAAGEEPGGIADDASEYEAAARDHVHQADVEEDPYKENLPSHSFEKIDFADNHDGGFRRIDGADDMEEQAESLDGVDLRELIRGGPEVESIYKAELGDVGDIPDVDGVRPGERGVTYDEWDQKRRTYRRDWVTLYPTRIEVSRPDFGNTLRREVAETTRHAVGALEARRMERVARNRQPEGDELDVGALIEEYAERKRGLSPPGRVFVYQPRLERDLATCVLLDLSLSADSWVQNQRVLDVELAAACVLGEVANTFGDDLAMFAYASNTRNLCRTWTVKDWAEPWTVGRGRLGALAPQGYTRIGPALRHGTAALVDRPNRTKHLLVLTDGKPTDFDRYEGGHGVHDVAWAVREARRAGVHVHAVCFDPRAAVYLPAMFGPGGWTVVRQLGELPSALVRAYA